MKEQNVKLWNFQGDLLATLEGHSAIVLDVEFNSDSSKIATASADNTVKIWNINHDKSLATLEGHSDSVLGVKFQPYSQKIASASVDKTIKLWQWDGNEAKLERTLIGHLAAVQSLDFSSDGQTLTSGSNDRTVILWTKQSLLESEDLMFDGCNWIRNYLSYNHAVAESDRQLCDGVMSNK